MGPFLQPFSAADAVILSSDFQYLFDQQGCTEELPTTFGAM